MEENKFYKQAREELEYLSGDPDFQRLLESRAGFLMDMNSYRIQCEEEAATREKMEIAKKLKAKNMSIEEIIELTGLTKEEVEKL